AGRRPVVRTIAARGSALPRPVHERHEEGAGRAPHHTDLEPEADLPGRCDRPRPGGSARAAPPAAAGTGGVPRAGGALSCLFHQFAQSLRPLRLSLVKGEVARIAGGTWNRGGRGATV